MAFRDILNGRKCRVSNAGRTNVAPEIASLMRAFAREYRPYQVEAASYLITIGLSQHEGWVLDEEESLRCLPKPLLGKDTEAVARQRNVNRQGAEQWLPRRPLFLKVNLFHFR